MRRTDGGVAGPEVLDLVSGAGSAKVSDDPDGRRVWTGSDGVEGAAAPRPAWTRADWWELPISDAVRGLVGLSPGVALATRLASVPDEPCRHPHPRGGESAAGRAAGCPCACQVVTAAAWEAQVSWTTAQSAKALVAAAGAQPVELRLERGRVVQDPAREELAHAVRLSPLAMANHLAHARSLVAHPALLRLLESGGISVRATRLVLDETRALSKAQAAELVGEVCARVEENLASTRRAWTATDIGRRARGLRLRLFGGQPEIRRRAFADRKVGVYPGDGTGMADLVARLDQTDAHRIHRRLSAIAHGLRADLAGCGDTRTQDQLRADVFVDLFLGRVAARSTGRLPMSGSASDATGAESGPGPEAGSRPPNESASCGEGSAAGQSASLAGTSGGDGDRAGTGATSPPARPEINVIVSLETLLGLDDGPANVPGLGPIPAEIARTLAADGHWRAWVTDAAGAVQATGNLGYQPSAALARAVRARDPHCRFPGCRQPAQRCDLDHAIPYPRGRTTASNLGPLCRRHHVLKTHAGWALTPHEGLEVEARGHRADGEVGRAGDEAAGAGAGGQRADGPRVRQRVDGPRARHQRADGQEAASQGEHGQGAVGRGAVGQGAVGQPVGGPRADGRGDRARSARAADGPVAAAGAASLSPSIAGWSWRSPSGFTVRDQSEPPLDW